MNLKKIKTPNGIFYVSPERFEIVSPDNSINYFLLKKEIDSLIEEHLYLDEKEQISLSSSLEFLLSISEPEEGLYEWGSNLMFETPKSYKNYSHSLDIIKRRRGFFEEIPSVLEEYLFLKDYILSYRAYYFDHIAFSGDDYSLKKDMNVYFTTNNSLRIGKVYSYLKEKVKLSIRSDEFIDLDFNKVFCEKDSLK